MCTRLSKRLLGEHREYSYWLSVLDPRAMLIRVLSDFILQDSHGVVYPSPPPFGVPPHVLRALRDDLVAAVVQWVIEQADSMHEDKRKRDFEIYNPPVVVSSVAGNSG